MLDLDTAKRLRERWARDPDCYARTALGVRLWSKQVEVLESVVVNTRTGVGSGHNIGKTFMAGVAVNWFMDCHVGARVISAAPTFVAVKGRLWVEVRRLRRRARIPLGGRFLSNAPVLRFDTEGWEAVGIAAGAGDAFQGIHGRHVLIVFDEAQGMKQEIWEAAESMLGGEHNRMLAIFNPLHSEGNARATFYEKKALWKTFSISCLDHPNVLAEKAGAPRPYPEAVSFKWCEEIRRSWGDNSVYYRARVLGQFSDEGSGVIIPYTFLARCAGLEDIEGKVPFEIHAGLDVARFGDDQNVLTIFADRRLVWLETWEGLDLIKTAGRTRHIAGEWGISANHVHVDSVGIGAGVVDRLAEERFTVDAVNFGEAPAGEWEELTGEVVFKNRRAELYWVLRLLLQTKQVIIPEEYAEAWAQLSAALYFFDPTDRLQVEPKDEIKKRLGRSPDHADACVLACSRSGSSFRVGFV